MTGNWQPLITALAALVGALTPALVNLMVNLSTHAAVGRVERSTNGHLASITAELTALRTVSNAAQVSLAADTARREEASRHDAP